MNNYSFQLMGVLNVTPDSFSDGGLFVDPDAACAHAMGMLAEGADFIDVGGESTRPGAIEIPAQEQIRRVVPVIERISSSAPDARISIDTTRLAVAQAAVTAGATYINDVSAFRVDPELGEFVADRGLNCCLMHMIGTPRTMQDNPRYKNVVNDVRDFLESRLQFALDLGISIDKIHLDPGIGFGKTLEHDLELLKRLREIVAIGPPVLIGVSRKKFLGRLTGRDPSERIAGTIAANISAFINGASIFRVHDVAETRDALTVTAAISPRE